VSDETINETIDETSEVEAQPEFKPIEVVLYEAAGGTLVPGILALVPVVGHGLQPIAAVSIEVAEAIASLAYPNCKVGKGGYAKNKPCNGDQVWFQVPAVVLDEKKSAGKDIAEAKRRGDINFERRSY
jgi:hypothetical protein